MARFPGRPSFIVPLAHGRALTLGERPLVMGILNVTPDSFAEAAPLDPADALERALALQEGGADIVDVGGESTRPGATPVSADEEIARVVPLVARLAPRMRVPISVDTSKAVVAAEAVAAGACLVNDISGFQYDSAMAGIVAASGAAAVLMHTRGRPSTMYSEAHYEALIDEVCAELNQAVDRATAQGVAEERLILDPGLGFAKRALHSYGVLARVGDIARVVGRPLLIGPSRKSFMAEALDHRPPLERDWGTAAAVTAAVLGGAHIVRVHAVAEMAQVVRVAEQIRRGQREGASDA